MYVMLQVRPFVAPLALSWLFLPLPQSSHSNCVKRALWSALTTHRGRISTRVGWGVGGGGGGLKVGGGGGGGGWTDHTRFL